MSDLIEIILEILFDIIFDDETYKKAPPVVRFILIGIYAVTFIGIIILLYALSVNLISESMVGGILILLLAILLTIYIIYKTIKLLSKPLK